MLFHNIVAASLLLLLDVVVSTGPHGVLFAGAVALGALREEVVLAARGFALEVGGARFVLDEV